MVILSVNILLVCVYINLSSILSKIHTIFHIFVFILLVILEMRSVVSCHKYKSSFYGIKAKHDHEAKKGLSDYAHKNIFQVALGNSVSLSHKVHSDGTSNIIWPTGQHQFEGNSRIIQAVQGVTVYLELSMTVNANMSYVFHPCLL